MKWVLRSQLKQLHRRFGFTMVYVTHDQTEALSFADQVVVMYDGAHRADRHAGRSVRAAETHLRRLFHRLAGHERAAGQARWPQRQARRPGHRTARRAASRQPGQIELGIRPEYVHFATDGMPVDVTKVEDIGRHKVVRANLQGQEIALILDEDSSVPADAKVGFDPAGINLYADSWRVEMGS